MNMAKGMGEGGTKIGPLKKYSLVNNTRHDIEHLIQFASGFWVIIKANFDELSLVISSKVHRMKQ